LYQGSAALQLKINFQTATRPAEKIGGLFLLRLDSLRHTIPPEHGKAQFMARKNVIVEEYARMWPREVWDCFVKNPNGGKPRILG